MVLAPAQLTPRWYPLRFHGGQTRLFRSPARFNVVEVARRSGKTEILKRLGVLEGQRCNPGLEDFLVIFAAPTRDQAKHIYWDDLKSLIPSSWLRRDPVETSLEIHTKVGTTYAVVGMDRPKRIEGRPVDLGLYDEFAEYKQDAWAKTIRPCASTDGRPGRVWIYGVPRPSVQFAELATRAKEDKSGEWAYHHWTAASLLSPEEVASARRDMDERTFAQEYEASRVNASGRAYYTFSRDVHMVDDLPYNRRAPLILTLDFNVEPGTAAVLQEHVGPDGSDWTDGLGEVWIPSDSSTEAVCNKFLADWGDHEGDVVVDGDPAGGSRKTTGEADWTVVRSVLLPRFGSRLRIQHGHAAPGVRDRVVSMNTRLRTADGKSHMRFERARCKRIAADLEGVQWKQGADGELEKRRDPMLTHLSDGIGYYVHRKHGAGSRQVTITAV